MKNNGRKKLTVTNPFPIYPPTYGGQLRVYNLYLQLSRWFDIDIVVYANPGIKTHRRQLAERLFEIRVPRTMEHCKIEAILIEESGIPMSDIALLKCFQYTPEYMAVLEDSCKDSEVVICSHPYTYNAVKAIGQKRIWYDAQNVEYLLKKSMLPEGRLSEELLALIREAERECCEKSDLILACSNEDRDSLSELYSIDKDKIIIVPNGTNVSDIKCVLPNERLKSMPKDNMKKKSAVFVGSAHGPNLIAVDHMVKMAIELPWVQFIIVGSASEHLENESIPDNIVAKGILERKDKDEILSNADIALNPMTYGSGTNLKILEYFAFGIPVISTLVGIRGLNVKAGDQAIICDIDEFSVSIRELLATSTDDNDKLAKNARKFVEDNFDWGIIARRLTDELKKRGMFKELWDDKYQLCTLHRNDGTADTFNYDLDKIRSRNVYIWGAGSAGRKALKSLHGANIDIKGFVDSDLKKHGSLIDDIYVFSPEGSLITEKVGRPFIIIASTYVEEIEKQLSILGYRIGEDYLMQDINNPYLYLYS